MSRRLPREAVFKLVYERCVAREGNELSFSEYTAEFEGEELNYCRNIYDGTAEKGEFLTRIIENYSVDFKIERVYKIDLAILIVACYEILFLENVPYQAAANEAVELAKKYSTEKSFKFINGVLSSVIKDKEKLLKGVDS
jgi:N utilization substance protein B